MIQRIFSNNAIRTFVFVLVLILVLTPVTASWGGCGKTKPANIYTELLGLIPAEAADTESPVYFILIDYASFYKDNDITFTTIEDLRTEIKKKSPEVLRNMPGEGSYITGYSSYAEYSTIKEQYVGYDVGDVEAEIRFGMPPAEGVAAIGRFDSETTKQALSNRDEWPGWAVAEYAMEEYHGVTIHSWGDGFKIHMSTQGGNRFNPPHIDELGRAMPLAVTDKYLFYHPSMETIKQMIDASQNKGKMLADLPEYAIIIDHLTNYNIYSVALGNAAAANMFISSLKEATRMTEEEKAAQIEQGGKPLKKFLTCGSGRGSDEKGTFAVFVIYHENSSDARENVSLFRQRLENHVSLNYDKSWPEIIKDSEIKADGRIMTAKLYTEALSLRWSWIIWADSLLYHEE